MSDPDKADVYRRTENNSGKIMPDGLVRWDKKTYEDVLIKKGRAKRNR